MAHRGELDRLLSVCSLNFYTLSINLSNTLSMLSKIGKVAAAEMDIKGHGHSYTVPPIWWQLDNYSILLLKNNLQ